MKTIYMLLGLVLCFGSLWAGSYVLGTAEKDSWFLFPTYLTMLLCGLGGGTVFLAAAAGDLG